MSIAGSLSCKRQRFSSYAAIADNHLFHREPDARLPFPPLLCVLSQVCQVLEGYLRRSLIEKHCPSGEIERLAKAQCTTGTA